MNYILHFWAAAPLMGYRQTPKGLMLTQGTVVHAGYRILDAIAQGDLSEVYKAERLDSNRLCVLKVLSPALMSDAPLVARFKQEAKKACTFRHPNAARIEEAGEADDGRPFVVMEYVAGENLRNVMGRKGRLPVERACSVARQVATVLEAAHSEGLVHQDLTPGHIMLVKTPEGEQVKLLDCCLARTKEERRRDMGSIALKQTGVLMGTPAYFSPEMAVGRRGDELDGRSDLYSLGVVLYQMLSGKLPFEAKTNTMDALLAHLLIPPTPIRELLPDLPEDLGSLVMRMLEKKSSSRPASAHGVVEELERVASRLRQTPAMAASVASGPKAREALAEVALAEVSTPPTVTTLPPQSRRPAAAGSVLGLRVDTARPQTATSRPDYLVAAGLRAAVISRAQRRWLRPTIGIAVAALALSVAGWYLEPLRSKLAPYFKPLETSAPTSSPAPGISSPVGTGQKSGDASQPAIAPEPRPNAPPAKSAPPVASSRTAASGTSAVARAYPQPGGERPAPGALRDQGVAGKQSTGSGKPASEAKPAPRPPSANLATVRSLTTEGDGFFRRGDYDRAIQSYQRALRLVPTSEVLHTKIARARTAKAAEEKYLNE